MSVRMALAALALALFAVSALAQTPGSLRDRPSRLERVTNAPQTQLTVGGPASQLQSANIPQTNFRMAEVPPARLEATKVLLRELSARQTPEQAVVISLPADVLFDFDSAALRPDALPALQRAGELLQSYPRAPIEIHGHTDAKGTAAYNDVLSQKRAQSVANRLSPGAGGRTLAVRGFGKERPVAANTQPDGSDDPDGRQRNRRVEIVIQPVP
jgi:outer membrane protein OmpA-like peptidoglycan-associated protein